MTALPSPLITAPRHWRALGACPAEWADDVARCGGGFFQTPLAIAAGAPAGDPLFFTLAGRGTLDAIAVGIRHACRLSDHPRHVYLPSPPVVRDPALRDEALEALVQHLRVHGIADVTMDSFDARWQPSAAGATSSIRRREYTVALNGGELELLARCAEHHRRKIKRGARRGWQMRFHVGADAREVLENAHGTARQRAAARGAAFRSAIPPVVEQASTGLDAQWGVAVLGAWEQDTLLSAVLVGWGGQDAYSLVAGSTADGYAQSASIWLQFQIITALAQAGFRAYNLGGVGSIDTPMTDAQRGLIRFKLGFGAKPMDCLGTRWILRSFHVKGHDLRRRVTAWYQA